MQMLGGEGVYRICLAELGNKLTCHQILSVRRGGRWREKHEHRAAEIDESDLHPSGSKPGINSTRIKLLSLNEDIK